MTTDSEGSSPLPSPSPSPLPSSVRTGKRKLNAPQRYRDDDGPVKRSKNDTDNPYSDALSTTDANLISLVDAYSRTKPWLRAVSYAFPKWPWVTSIILDNASLAVSLHARDSVPKTVMDLALALDDWERTKIYAVRKGTDSAMCYFRRLGIEKLGSVTPGAHDFGQLHDLLSSRSLMVTHKILVVYRTLDILAWLSGAPEVARARGTPRSPDIGKLVPTTFTKFDAINDWISALNGTAEACRPRTTASRPRNLPAIDWDHLDIIIPSHDEVSAAKKRLGDSDDFHTGSHTAICNIKSAAFGLCFLLEECHEERDNLSYVNFIDLKTYCGGDINLCRRVWETLSLALFVSPVLLLCGKDIPNRQAEIPIKRLWEFWRLLGNTGRPAELIKTERQVWRIILDVARGFSAPDCIASFAEYWLKGPRNQRSYIELSSWFVNGERMTATTNSSTQNSFSQRPVRQDASTDIKVDKYERSVKQIKTGSASGATQTMHMGLPNALINGQSLSTPGPSTSAAGPSITPAASKNIASSSINSVSSSSAAGRINSMKQDLASLRQDVQKKDELIIELKHANASLTRAREIEGHGKILKQCIELLEGHPERRGVHDLSGAMSALQDVIARLSNAATSKEKELENLREENRHINEALGL
ncbi:unnamed protein product [Peniophora sp. CBMAI 1063]|nr:unnamed protein product [Peniophora sp. CBMAI 1063]